MSIPTRQKFMEVKQKLDFYRLPTSFPPQATNIISKLLQKIQQKSISKNNINTDRTKDSISSPLSPRTNSNSILQNNSKSQKYIPALQQKIKQLLKQNNHLNKQLMQSKQHIEILRQCKQLQRKYDHFTSSNSMNKQSSNPLTMNLTQHTNQIHILRNGFQVLKARQIQLFQQLTQIKYKYNQLMDLIHQDPGVQKKYIKRLLKHKKYQNNNDGIQMVSSSKQKDKIMIENYYKSQTSYSMTNGNGMKKKPSNHQVSQSDVNRLQIENYKLTCLNNNFKLKLENRELEILRLQHKLQDQFNVDGLSRVYELKEKDNQIGVLKGQVDYLMRKLNDCGKYATKMSLEKETQNMTNGKHNSKGKYITTGNNERKQSINKKQNKNYNSTHNLYIKSPTKYPLIVIKSPTKHNQKQKNHSSKTDSIKPLQRQACNKQQNPSSDHCVNPKLASKQHRQQLKSPQNNIPASNNQLKSPKNQAHNLPHSSQSNQIAQLKKTNKQLKNQVSILLNELQIFKKSSILSQNNQQNNQAGFQNQRIRDFQNKNYATNQVKNNMNKEIQSKKYKNYENQPQQTKSLSQERKSQINKIDSKANKNNINTQKQLQELKILIKQKQNEIKKMQMRWKNSQQENRILIEELEEKRYLIEQIFNGTMPQALNYKQNDNNKESNDNPSTKGNIGKNKYDIKKPPYNNGNNNGQDYKKTNLKTTNIQTTTNNMLSTTNNLQNSKGTLVYSPANSEYNNRQPSQTDTKQPRGSFSECIQIDLKSDFQESKINPYPSNIHSTISSQKNSKKSAKLPQQLNDIQQQDSLQKSHHSDQERRSKINKSKGLINNSIPIRVSIKNHNDQVEEQVYESRMYSSKSSNIKDHQRSKASLNKEQKSNKIVGFKDLNNGDLNKNDFQSLKKENLNHQNQNQQQNNQNGAQDKNYLQVQDSDKASVFSMRRQIDQLKIDNRKQTKTKKKLQRQLKQSQQERQKLQDTMYELQAKIAQLQAQMKQKNEKDNKGTLKFIKQSNNNDGLNNNDGTIDSQIIDRKLKIKIKEQDQRIAELEEENIQTAMQIRDKDGKIKNLEQKIQSLSSKIDQLNQTIKQLQQQNRELSKEKQNLFALAGNVGNLNEQYQNGNKIVKNNIPSSTKQNLQSQSNQNNTTIQTLKAKQVQIQHSNQILWLKKQFLIRFQHYKPAFQNILKRFPSQMTTSPCIVSRNNNFHYRS